MSYTDRTYEQAGEGTEGHRAEIVRASSSGCWLRAGPGITV